MKRTTTKKGAPKSRSDAINRWEKCWREDLTQGQIQAWIERIPWHIEQIIALEGGNEYKEGRKKEGDSIDRVVVRPVEEDRIDM
jgi:hypothetical protein